MDKKTEEILKQILANQVIIYKRLEQIEKAIKGGSRSAPIKSYVDELKKEADKAITYIQ